MKAAILVITGLFLVGTAAAGVSDFDNAPFAPGFYLQGYPAYSTATKIYNADGEAQDMGDTWSAINFSLRPTYCGMLNQNRWQVSAAVPFTSNTPAGGDAESGIGDVQLSATYWILDDHRQGNFFSFWLWSDLPTGDDEKGLGTGQLNLRPGLAYTMERFPYQVQASAYYNLRMKDSDEVKPGDEIWGNFAFGYGVNENTAIGLDAETGWGQDLKLNSTTVPDTKQQWFRVGPSFEYQINPNVGLKLKGLYNVMGTNSPQSIDIWARVNWGL